jgi:hypothetical protein
MTSVRSIEPAEENPGDDTLIGNAASNCWTVAKETTIAKRWAGTISSTAAPETTFSTGATGSTG